MKKNKFKIGDRVRVAHKPEWGVGEVVQIDIHDYQLPLKVEWPQPNPIYWHNPKELEFAETPIQRMRRRYNEV